MCSVLVKQVQSVMETNNLHESDVVTSKETSLCDMFELLAIEIEHNSSSTDREITCSKNVLRKQRNWEKRVAAKKMKRGEERQRRKQNQNMERDDLQLSKRVTKAITKERLALAISSGPRLCVDLSMVDHMSQKERSRLAGQIRRLYGSNRKAQHPFHLYLTELGQETLMYAECSRMNDGFSNYMIEMSEQSWLDLFPCDDVIYLTPDAEEALHNMEDNKIYILGGLVDESIQKKMTYLRAVEAGVRTARLPIEEHMVKRPNSKNFHSKVLAINQVFDILLAFRETGSWEQALPAGVPAGKGYMLSKEMDST